jgi:hypothetical protein
MSWNFCQGNNQGTHVCPPALGSSFFLIICDEPFASHIDPHAVLNVGRGNDMDVQGRDRDSPHLPQASDRRLASLSRQSEPCDVFLYAR